MEIHHYIFIDFMASLLSIEHHPLKSTMAMEKIRLRNTLGKYVELLSNEGSFHLHCHDFECFVA